MRCEQKKVLSNEKVVTTFQNSIASKAVKVEVSFVQTCGADFDRLVFVTSWNKDAGFVAKNEKRKSSSFSSEVDLVNCVSKNGGILVDVG